MEYTQKPLYEQIYEDIKAKINEGTYEVGSLLPTEKDFCKLYNVSRITMQKALQLLVGDDLIQKKAGIGSRVLRQERFPESNHLIGLILPGILESYGDTLLRAISDEFSAVGYSVIIKFSNESQELESRYVRQLIELPVQGLLIAPLQRTYYNPKLIECILQGFPVVILDKELVGINSLLVSTDHLASSYTCASYVYSTGQRKLSILSYHDITNSTLERRQEGFINVYAEHDHPLTQSNFAPVVKSYYLAPKDQQSIETDVDRIENYLLQAKPTCIVVLDSYLAYLAKEALHRLGWSIPNDVSFIGFDSASASYPSDLYTCLEQDEVQIAKSSVKLILKAIKHEPIDEKQILIPGKLIHHHTVAHLN